MLPDSLECAVTEFGPSGGIGGDRFEAGSSLCSLVVRFALPPPPVHELCVEVWRSEGPPVASSGGGR